jgi:flavin-dependent dehydrogenase
MDRYDVAILGGGLAGLTLALQVKRARPETSVLVLEKRKGPAPLAAFKVGESTLEVGAHYFADICGLRDHLDADHVYKPGLRYFFPAGDNRDVTRRTEWGPPAGRPFRLKTWQIDRGRFENELADRCRAAGVDLRDGCPAQDVDLREGDADHTVMFAQDGEEGSAAARWVVGATGRASLIRRKLGLEREVEHAINSSWLRLRGGLKLDDWSDDPDWKGRMQEPIRWMYTNHLMGKGYWVWLIPLSSGAISIGIVADPRFHPYERINTLEAALDWLDEHEPLVAEAVRARPDDIEDFLRIEHYSHGTERQYSPDRWGLTGDAGVFLDPFYSPGSDFIAIANGCLADLVLRDLAGEPIEERAEAFNHMFLEEFHRILHNYTWEYEIWGNPQVMSVKLCWDLLLYWGVTALRAIHGVWHDPDFYASVRDTLDRAHRLNQRMQGFFREWHAIDDREVEGVFVPLVTFGALAKRKVMLDGPHEPDVVRGLLAENVDCMEAVAVAIFRKARESLSEGEVDGDRPVNPNAIGLDPSRWEQDGLFDEPGLTLEQAGAQAHGIENIWLDYLAQAPPLSLGPPGAPGPPEPGGPGPPVPGASGPPTG